MAEGQEMMVMLYLIVINYLVAIFHFTNIFSALTSIQALKLQNVPHDRFVVLIEGSEESGSIDLDYYIDAYAKLIGVAK